MSSLLQQWITEFCSPVVVTLASGEAERICLQNGLLLHELLSCFGHLIDVSASIRIGKQAFTISETHLRFERATETKPKNAELMESILASNFVPFDIHRLPTSVGELKSAPPSAWTHTLEQLAVRSMSFSEFEMISHPLVVMSVISTSDIDPIASMQELTSIHHTPACFTNGQYDPSIHRVYVVLDDASNRLKDPLTILRSLQNYFPSASTKILTINSLPPSSPNIHQPDMWSRYLIPKYFPRHAPTIDINKALPLSPMNNMPVIGCRLSGDDFMKLQDFCVWLFTEQITPHLERRINILHTQVNESKKGMKNVLKSFWRKPRDENDFARGGLKYRYDKIETQIMMLGDISFIIKDYETAISMYRLVRDDYKADKANLHYMQVVFMITVCQLLTEPQKYKEIFSQIESLGQCMAAGVELPHASLFYGLLCAEIYTYHQQYRSPLDAAKILLVGATSLAARYPLQCSLLMERASMYFLQGNQVRKYVFHEVLSGHKYFKCGGNALKHASICYAASLMILEKSGWADIKVKLAKALTRDLKNDPRDGIRRSLLFMLKVLFTALQDSSDSAALMEAVSVLSEIQSTNHWGNIRVLDNWTSISAREALLGSLPIEDLPATTPGKSEVEICNLPVPTVDPATVKLVEPINGLYTLSTSGHFSAYDRSQRDLLLRLYNVERTWVEEKNSTASSGSNSGKSLHERWVKALTEEPKDGFNMGGGFMLNDAPDLQKVPLGEKLFVSAQFHNKLPVDISLTKLRCLMEESDAFEVTEMEETLHPDDTIEVNLELAPKVLGKYEINCLGWNIGEKLSVRQSVKKQGPLLQRTIQQRADGARGEDHSLRFEVIPAQPLLGVVFDGVSAEVLQGQLLRATLVLRNMGAAPAKEIFLKLSEPSFIFMLATPWESSVKARVMEFCGPSCSLVRLEDVVIQPGKEVRLDAWVRLLKPGPQRINLLAVYHNGLESEEESTPVSTASRTSYVSVETTCLPSFALQVEQTSHTHAAMNSTLLTEIANLLPMTSENLRNLADLRMSSVGQIDMDVGSAFAEVDDNMTKVISVMIMGAAQPVTNKSTRSRAAASVASRANVGIHVSPNERYAKCFPITATPHHNQCSWVIPLPEESISIFQRSSLMKLDEIIERFVAIWYSMEHFSRELEIARQILLEEELQASEAGPRSIAEVRRARQRMQEEAERLEGEIMGATGPENPMHSGSHTDIMQTLQEVAFAESRKGTLGVAVLWVCRWQNKLRWGLHHAHHIRRSIVQYLDRPMHSVATANVKSLATSAGPPGSNQATNDWIIVGLKHSPLIGLSASSSSVAASARQRSTLTINVDIRSVHNKTLYVTIQTIDEAATAASQQMVNHPFSWSSASCQWVGKTRFEDVEVLPHDAASCQFTVHFFSPGVFDVNRFEVTVSTEPKTAPNGVSREFTRVVGQSLITVGA
jgi:hypothetical protein